MRHIESFQLPPRTAMEVFSLLPEGTLCEVVENQLYMGPSPNRKHQELSAIIFGTLFQHIRNNNLGAIYHAPTDVYLDSKNIFQPDIVFVSTKNKNALSIRGIEGAPDLAIEILSPSNAEHDTKRKKAVYERCGVKEFWIVDAEARSVYGFMLSKGKYQSLGRPSKKIRLKIFALEIDLSKDL